MTHFDGSTTTKPTNLFALAASLAAVIAGVLILIGWWLEMAAFKSIIPGLANMKPITAVAFAFCGAGLFYIETQWGIDLSQGLA